MHLSRKIIIASRTQCCSILQETQTRNSFPTKSHLDVPDRNSPPQSLFSTFANPSYSTLFILNQNALQLGFMGLCVCVWSRVDINDTGTRHGVAAGDCPSVHTDHHHLAIIPVFAPPAQYIYTPQAQCIRCVKLLVTRSGW
jgi:hypothetical protein